MSCVACVVVPLDETGVTTRTTTESLAYPSLTVVSPKLLFSASPAKPCWRSHASMFTASSELADFAIMTTPERVNFVGLPWPVATYQSKLCGTAMENLRLLFVFRSLRSCRAGPIFTAGAFVSPCRPPWPSMYLSLIHISEPTRLGMISYAVFCLKKKKKQTKKKKTLQTHK